MWADAEGQRRVEEAAAIGERHGFGREATLELLDRLTAGHGHQAQFSHPELGGMGQWSGGMTMVGRMGDADLRDRVGALAAELSRLVRSPVHTEALARPQSEPSREPRPAEMPSLQPMKPMQPMQPMQPMAASEAWWPAALGSPASTGAQNGRRYASFPDQRRLAVEQDGTLSLFDSGDHVVTGFAQSQPSGAEASLTLTTEGGPVALSTLKRIA